MQRFRCRSSTIAVTGVLVLAAGCSQRVTIPDPGEDTTPPVVDIRAIWDPDIGAVVADSDGQAPTAMVLAGQGDDLVIVANARDDGGVEELRAEVLSGGHLQLGQSAPTTEATRTGSTDNPRDRLMLSRALVPSDPDEGTVTLRAHGRDFSGNEAQSEPLTVQYLTPASLSLDLSASPVMVGEEVTVSWQASGSNITGRQLHYPDVQGQMQVESVGASGSRTLSIDESGVYSIALGASTQVDQPGPTTRTRQLHVQDYPEPVADIAATPASACAGDTITLTWDTENADNAVLSPPGDPVSLSGSEARTVNADTSYTLTATQAATGDTASDEAGVSLIVPPDEIRVNKTASVPAGGNPEDWREATVTTQDISEDCATFASIKQVRLMESGLPPQTWVRILFEPDSGSTRDTRFLPNSMTTSHFNGMDPRGTWKLIYSTPSLMPQISFRITLE